MISSVYIEFRYINKYTGGNFFFRLRGAFFLFISRLRSDAFSKKDDFGFAKKAIVPVFIILPLGYEHTTGGRVE